MKLVPKDGGTLLTYDVEAQIGGKLAQLGQRLINGAAKKVADDFFDNFVDGGQPEERLRRPLPTASPAAGAYETFRPRNRLDRQAAPGSE